jgi:hypothetical protein
MRSLLWRWMLAVALGCGWGAATSRHQEGAGSARKWACVNANSVVTLQIR